MKASWQYYHAVAGKAHIDRLKEEALMARTIKNARQAQGLSQQELAEAMGKSKSTIGRIEGGITVPNEETRKAIARVLQINLPLNETNDEKT